MSPVPFQLLELNIISAQDLALVSKNLRTYAITWVNPDKKLRTTVDSQGQNNPNWNEKFVFRVDDKCLDSDTTAVTIQIYALGWLRDIPLGSVEVLLGDLIPPSVRHHQNKSRRRLVALQIRRPSGRPQGILNVCVTLLDNNLKSMPLYAHMMGSVVGFEDVTKEKTSMQHENTKPEEKPLLRRSYSDLTDVKESILKQKNNKGGSVCDNGGGSVVEGTSMVQTNGPIYDVSIVNGSPHVNGSEVGIMKGGGWGGNGSACNYSDVGPSASVVAAAVAQGLYPTTLPKPRKEGNSILGDWMVEDANVEGIKSKIERWKTELPPLYDNNTVKKYNPKKRGKKNSKREKNNRISCFGGACQITIVCRSK